METPSDDQQARLGRAASHSDCKIIQLCSPPKCSVQVSPEKTVLDLKFQMAEWMEREEEVLSALFGAGMQ